MNNDSPEITIILTDRDVLALIRALADPDGVIGFQVGTTCIEIGRTDDGNKNTYLWLQSGYEEVSNDR